MQSPAMFASCFMGIFSLIPSVVPPQPTSRDALVVATVERKPITLGEFRTAYRESLDRYKGADGKFVGRATERFLRELAEQTLDNMIARTVEDLEVERMKITVTDAEVQQYIQKIPAFQENGRFIGEERYRLRLLQNSPPITTAEFETRVRRDVVLEKLRSAVARAGTITETEISNEQKRRRERPSDWGADRLTREAVRAELSSVAREQAFEAYIKKARGRMKVVQDEVLISQVAAGR